MLGEKWNSREQFHLILVETPRDGGVNVNINGIEVRHSTAQHSTAYPVCSLVGSSECSTNDGRCNLGSRRHATNGQLVHLFS